MNKILVLFLAIFLVSCNSQKKYSDFDISYSRSGGFAPIYENFIIKGNNVVYSFEGHSQKKEAKYTLTNDELQRINIVLTTNKFRFIQEDHKKIYDAISTTINVKSGPNSGSKSDASLILPKDQKKWEKITTVFREIIDSKVNSK